MSRAMHVLTGPRVPERACDPFLCEHFHGTLLGGECLRRQTKRMKASATWTDQSPRIPPHLEYCASGNCEQGLAIAKKFPDWKPEDRPPPNWAAQMEARRAAEAAAPPIRGLAPRPAPVEPVEQLKRECAEIVLSMKKPSWQEFKKRKDSARAEEPVPEKAEAEPHPLSRRGLEYSMAEESKPICSEPGCKRTDRLTKGLCGMHYQRSRAAGKNGKATNGKARATEALTGQDEFDLMIRIRDDFRLLSPPGQRYVLEALKGSR